MTVCIGRVAVYGTTNSLPHHNRHISNILLTMSLENIPDTNFEPYCGRLEHYTYWRSVTDGRFVLAKGTLPDFIRQYVPSSKPYPPLTPKGTPTDELRICRDVLDPRDKCLPLVRAHIYAVARALLTTSVRRQMS